MGPEDLTGDRPPRKQPVLIRSKNRSIKKALPVSAEPVKPIEEEASSKQPGDSSGNLQKQAVEEILREAARRSESGGTWLSRKKVDKRLVDATLVQAVQGNNREDIKKRKIDSKDKEGCGTSSSGESKKN